MINSFLVTLVNDGTPPVNLSSLVGDILWPTLYLPRTFSTVETEALAVLFENETDNLYKLLRAIQLLWVVEESVCANKIVETDPRVSYTSLQLRGQFEGILDSDVSQQNITRILGLFDRIKATEFLRPDLLAIYRSSLSKMDKLGAVIAHFGVRPS